MLPSLMTVLQMMAVEAVEDHTSISFAFGAGVTLREVSGTGQLHLSICSG